MKRNKKIEIQLINWISQQKLEINKFRILSDNFDLARV